MASPFACDDDCDDDTDADLSDREKIELLRHRCFVSCAKRHADRWPYDWRLVERPNKALQLTNRSRGTS